MILLRLIPIPFLASPLKGEGHNGFAPHQEEGHKNFPPLQGEGKGGGGLNQMPIQLRID